jgi:hypothetical protein
MMTALKANYLKAEKDTKECYYCNFEYGHFCRLMRAIGPFSGEFIADGMITRRLPISTYPGPKHSNVSRQNVPNTKQSCAIIYRLLCQAI